MRVFLVLLAVAFVLSISTGAFAAEGIEGAFTAVQSGVTTAMGYAAAAVAAILGAVLVLMAGRALLRRFAKV